MVLRGWKTACHFWGDSEQHWIVDFFQWTFWLMTHFLALIWLWYLKVKLLTWSPFPKWLPHFWKRNLGCKPSECPAVAVPRYFERRLYTVINPWCPPKSSIHLLFVARQKSTPRTGKSCCIGELLITAGQSPQCSWEGKEGRKNRNSSGLLLLSSSDFLVRKSLSLWRWET